ncbi:MAG: TPM domain-containing protein [Caldilineaceae bacterium]
MHQWQSRSILLILIVYSLLWLALAVRVQAQATLPQAADHYVNDYADVIEADDEGQIRTLLTELKQQTGVEVTVLTIGSIADYQQDVSAVETFAPRIFNAWGIGDKSKNNGVLILVVVKDRQMRIQLGKGYTLADDQRMQRIIDDEMLPSFRQNRYSEGIRRGALATARVVGGEAFRAPLMATTVAPAVSNLNSGAALPTPQREAPVLRIPTTDSDADKGGGLKGLLVIGGGGIIALGGAGIAWRRYQRNRPRLCSQCRIAMQRLDEQADDAFLDAGQIREELLGSIDYDVWRCPTCNRHEVERYPSFFTVYKQCPQCGYQTVESSTQTLESPTEYSEGRKQLDQRCQHCTFKQTQIVTTPRLERQTESSNISSSDSDNSSYGGGSTSGGGASGRW